MAAWEGSPDIMKEALRLGAIPTRDNNSSEPLCVKTSPASPTLFIDDLNVSGKLSYLSEHGWTLRWRFLVLIR